MIEDGLARPIQRRPSSRALALAGALLIAAVASELWVFLGSLEGAEAQRAPLLASNLWWAAVVLATAIAALDFFAVRNVPVPEVKRILPRSLALHDWAEVTIEVTSHEGKGRELSIVDDLPIHFEAEGLPLHVPHEDSQRVRLKYSVRPTQRGDAEFGRPTFEAHSPFGLWRFTSRCGEAAPIRVYPNFAAVVRYGAIALDHHTHRVGIRLHQRRGAGLEFHQLREYREGDALRQVDWKATSRKQQLISREYQDERDQRIIFMLDCSRRMRAKDGDLSHFDHALNAMILLSHVALRGGDAVGLLSFGEENRWLPARKGVSSVNRILDSVYDLEATTVGSDFSAAAEDLCGRQSRRALIVLLTNVRREDLDDLLPGVAVLSRRHLVLVANLRSENLDRALQQEIHDLDDALRTFGAWHHQIERERVHDTLERSHSLTLDVTPSALPTQLINRYYAIKRSGEL